VFLDGYRYHATREHNRIASDCDKRNRLRAEGHVVFQITWDDLDLFEKKNGTRVEPVWPPYARTAQEEAKDHYEAVGGDRSAFGDAVFVNPFDTLLAYLENPDKEEWGRRAEALVSGCTRISDSLALQVDPGQARKVLRTSW